MAGPARYFLSGADQFARTRMAVHHRKIKDIDQDREDKIRCTGFCPALLN